jgi:hypothetical protein
MGKTPGSCDDATITENQKEAKRLVGDVARYAKVQVKVKSRDTAGNVELSLPKTDGTAEVLQTVWGDLKTMWAPCPSSLPSAAVPADPGTAPPTDAKGGLYISDAVLLTPEGKDKGIRHDAIKWPREFGSDHDGKHQTVKVWPTRIEVTGIADGSGIEDPVSVDLLDPNMAERNQQITSDPSALTLRLTRAGCQRFGVPFNARPFLAGAIEVIKSEQADPRALAAAWQIAVDVADQLRATQDDEDYWNLLREVLPNFKR